MPVVKCVECGGTVALSALTCPHCGAPGPAIMRRPTVIERTGRIWKFFILIGTIGAVVGLVGCIVDFSNNDPKSAAIFLLIALAGTVLALVGKAGAWWFHG